MNKYLLYITLFISCITSAFAQNKNELEAKKNQLLQEIASMQKQLDETQKNKTLSLNQITLLQKQIATRQNLITTYNSQLEQLSSQIDLNKNKYDDLVSQITQLKADYAKMVVYTYKHRSSYNTLLFIFSANNFNDALERLKYYKRYSAYRQQQAEQIVNMQTNINGQITVLNSLSASKKKMLSDEQQQAQVLNTQKKQQDQLVGKFQKQETQIRANLATKKTAANKLNKMIEDLIRKEIAANNAKAKNVTKNTTSANNTSSSAPLSKSKVEVTLTPEAQALANSFAENKGKLPWPVVQGTINEGFGIHPHPILKDVTTNNNGVDILTTPGATVRSVFRGTVIAVISNPGYHNALLILHGQYYTLYADLDEVYVKKGDEVATKQTIGKAFTDPTEGAIVHLEIWDGMDKMDPEKWLSQK